MHFFFFNLQNNYFFFFFEEVNLTSTQPRNFLLQLLHSFSHKRLAFLIDYFIIVALTRAYF